MTKPVSGDLWEYPYLWVREDANGETEGRKSRPVVFAVVLEVLPSKTYLYILPITGSEQDPSRDCLEIPRMEATQAGLDTDKRLWIVFDEHNRDTVEFSFYLNPSAKRQKRFSNAFTKRIAARFLEAYTTKRSGLVDRQ